MSEAPGKAIFWLPNLLFPPQPDLSSMPMFLLWICPEPEPAPCNRGKYNIQVKQTVYLFVHSDYISRIVLHTLTYASLATNAGHYSSAGSKRARKDVIPNGW